MPQKDENFMKLLLSILGSLTLVGSASTVLVKSNGERNIVKNLEKEKEKDSEWNKNFVANMEKVVNKDNDTEQNLKNVILDALVYDEENSLKVNLENLEKTEVVQQQDQLKEYLISDNFIKTVTQAYQNKLLVYNKETQKFDFIKESNKVMYYDNGKIGSIWTEWRWYWFAWWKI